MAEARKGWPGRPTHDRVLTDLGSNSSQTTRPVSLSSEPDWFNRQRGYLAYAIAGGLYHLRAYLAERRNLYADRPEVVRRLETLLEKYRAEGRTAPAQL
ncbi:MAG: hypothetical protein ACYC35_12595 [Pirellulales bacterium]